MINQKLRGLDVFESNESLPLPVPSTAGPSKQSETVIDPDELITRKHWQRPTGNDLCTEPVCGKGLGPLNGSINCRSCGRLFCEEHTMYQMKLSRSASHDPVRGYWVRVCETCYKSREGYKDHAGVEVDLTNDFTAMRRKRIERQNLEISRLEKRLTRLTRLLAEAPQDAPSSGTFLAPVANLTGQRNQRKTIEQSVVTWEDDASVSRCPFCKQEFGSWTFRRHHCRICGRVVCADPQTGCSTEVGLNVARPQDILPPRANASAAAATPSDAAPSEKQTPGAAAGQISMDIRMCRDCKATIFSARDFAESIAHKPPDQRAYETLCQFERGINLLMPSFQRALGHLQPDNAGAGMPPTRAQIQDAAKIRKRLMDSFAKYNLAARRIKELKTDSLAQARLQAAVYTAASTFLHANMVPLKHVPRLLRSQSSVSSYGGGSGASTPSGSGGQHRRLLSTLNGSAQHSPLRNGESLANGGGDTGSVAGSEASTAVSALETEEKDLRERLVVLEEQRFLVQEMINGARGTRRFEEVGALSRNLEELTREIDGLKKQIDGVEDRWEGLYADGELERNGNGK